MDITADLKYSHGGNYYTVVAWLVDNRESLYKMNIILNHVFLSASHLVYSQPSASHKLYNNKIAK